MNTLYTILAALAIVVGLLGSLTIITMLLAGGANSSLEQIRQLKFWMLVTSIGGLVCLAVGGVLIYHSHPAWAALVGILPMLVVIIGIVWVALS